MQGLIRLKQIIFAVLVALALPATSSQATTQRLALVIGNNAYTDGLLKNPINDARTMAATLRELGFEVRVLENADRTAMQRAVVEFGRKLNQDTVGLFYFAGHGMQVRGANYLIPVKASIESEDEVEVEGVDVAYVMARMATAKNQFNIVILDACRNNPFQRSFRSVSNGLAAISAPTGTLIAYATAPGSVASDGDAANGIYTSELVKAIRQPGLSMEEAFKQARGGVIARTQGKQTPWESSSVVGNFMFKATAPTQVASLAAPVRDSAAEIAFWNTVKDSQDARDYQAYVDSYPNGAFDRLARTRIASLGEAAKQRSAPAPVLAPAAEAKVARPAAEPKKDTVAVASLKSAPLPSKPNSAFVDTGDLEATLRQNWPAVEAALKAHVTAQYNTYRILIPANNALVTDVRLNQATLERVIDAEAGRIGVLLDGMLQSNTSYGSNQILWRPFKAQFTYDVKFGDGRVVIGPYAYVPPGQAQAPAPAMVASLQAPAANLNAGPALAGDYEALLRQNWPKVEAALKTHLQTDFAKYRIMVPSTTHNTAMPADLKLGKASLQSVDTAARRATILLTGQRHDGGSVWGSFSASFSYALDLVDDRVVIGEYHLTP
ncbi:caspase family protein [Ferrovibrio terrae]|nr:caspase family protein [Ferrovibrio terrae]